jgi:hypothetical protein
MHLQNVRLSKNYINGVTSQKTVLLNILFCSIIKIFSAFVCSLKILTETLIMQWLRLEI